MAKFAGEIGFAVTELVRPGVYQEHIIRRNYYGDVVRKGSTLQATDQVNDNLHLSNTISIVADEYVIANSSRIRFVNWMGTDWKISSIEIHRPRLVLYFGGVYNGPTTGSRA